MSRGPRLVSERVRFCGYPPRHFLRADRGVAGPGRESARRRFGRGWGRTLPCWTESSLGILEGSLGIHRRLLPCRERGGNHPIGGSLPEVSLFPPPRPLRKLITTHATLYDVLAVALFLVDI